MLQYSHRGPPITGAASEVSPLKLRLGPPCEGCPERNQQGAQQKAPLHQRGPLAIKRSTALGMGDISSLQALPQGHHQRSAKKKQSPTFHFAVGLACAAWAVVRFRAIWRFMDRIGAGARPLTSSSSDRSGCRPPSWIMGECEIGQVRSSGDLPGTCRLPRPKLEIIQSCSCDRQVSGPQA